MNKPQLLDYLSQNPNVILVGTAIIDIPGWRVPAGQTVLVTGFSSETLTVAIASDDDTFHRMKMTYDPQLGHYASDTGEHRLRPERIKFDMTRTEGDILKSYLRFMDQPTREAQEFEDHRDVCDYLSTSYERPRLLASAEVELPGGRFFPVVVAVTVAVDQFIVIDAENINEVVDGVGLIQRTSLDINESGTAYTGETPLGQKITLPVASIYSEKPTAPTKKAQEKPQELQEGDLVTRIPEGNEPMNYGRIVRIMDYVKIGASTNSNPDYAVPLSSLEVIKYAKVNMRGGDRIAVPLDSLQRYNSTSSSQR